MYLLYLICPLSPLPSPLKKDSDCACIDKTYSIFDIYSRLFQRLQFRLHLSLQMFTDIVCELTEQIFFKNVNIFKIHFEQGDRKSDQWRHV